MDLLERSEELHRRARALSDPALFEPLALEIAEFQARFSQGYARLVRARGSKLDRLSTLPAVPSDAFKLTRVAVHPPELDVASFCTSGTTAEARGVHHFRTLETYRSLSLAFGKLALASDREGPRTVVCLAPALGTPPTSSLGMMMQYFADAWDPHTPEQERWLVQDGAVNVALLERAARSAARRDEPLVLLATAFALVALLDSLAGRTIPAPPESAIMVTGGFKGRTREVAPEQLRADLARTFGVTEARLIGEYGMTELSSQLYEGTLPGGALVGPPGVFLEPPTLRVFPVDPVSLEPVDDGEIGLAKIVDVGNVDSAVAVQTQDRVRRVKGGIELLGRAPGAPPRGCSLALESLLS
jgi:hypothetical protein